MSHVSKLTKSTVVPVFVALLLGAPCVVTAIDVDTLEASRAAAAHELAAGDFAQARVAYEALLREVPEHPGIQMPYAKSLVGLGRLTDAGAVYRDLLDEGFGAILSDDPAFANSSDSRALQH